MNNLFIIVGGLIFIVFLIFKFGIKSSEADFGNRNRPNDSGKPVRKIVNDKVIVVSNLKLEYLQTAIEQYCNLANQEQYTVLPSLILLENNRSVIVFPYDIEFDQFCYFINYLKYAHQVSEKPDYRPDIKAWCTPQFGMTWITKEIANSQVMIYIPDWDTEYDNVYLTTQNHLGYKMGFALGDEHTKLDAPAIAFQNIPVVLAAIEGNETQCFE